MRTNTPEPDPYRRRFRMPKWNGPITVTDDHRLFRRLPEFSDWTKARHEGAARDYCAQASSYNQIWRELVDRSLAIYGNGDGVLISGVYRDHFPDAVKDALRVHAHGASDFSAKSLAHWRAAGRTLDTWRQYRDGFSD